MDKVNGFLAVLRAVRDQFVAFINLVTFRSAQLQQNFATIGGFTPSAGAAGAFGLPAFVEGGIVTRPTLALVGERWPEAIVPLTGKNAGGAISVHVGSVVIHKDADPQAVMQMLAREIQKQVQGAG